MRAVDKYLKEAIDFIDRPDSGFWDKKKKDQIPKVYKGYIASFGTILKQSGLLPAVVLFHKESDGESASKEPILKALFQMIKKKSGASVNSNTMIEFAKKINITAKQEKR
jgi:CRISPR/Cas system CMR-associated protein Cmr5 small subunit